MFHLFDCSFIFCQVKIITVLAFLSDHYLLMIIDINSKDDIKCILNVNQEGTKLFLGVAGNEKIRKNLLTGRTCNL